MKKLNKAVSIFALTFLIILFSSCGTMEQPFTAYENAVDNSVCTSEAFLAPSYNTFFVNIDNILTDRRFSWPEEFSSQFNVVQVEGVAAEELEREINKNIIEASTHWIDGVVLDTIPGGVNIFFQSDRYLSLANSFGGIHPTRADALYDFITIDMQTGKRIMLNNLVRVDEDFARSVYELSNIEGSLLTLPPNITNYYELLDELRVASLTQEEVYERMGAQHRDDGDIEITIEPPLFRTTFYLLENLIVIVFHREGGGCPQDMPHIAIPLRYVLEFLLVEEW